MQICIAECIKIILPKNHIYTLTISNKKTEALFVGSAVERREEVMSQQRVEGKHKDHYKAKT